MWLSCHNVCSTGLAYTTATAPLFPDDLLIAYMTPQRPLTDVRTTDVRTSLV